MGEILVKKFCFILYIAISVFSISLLICIYQFDACKGTRHFYSVGNVSDWTDYSQNYENDILTIRGTILADTNVNDILAFYSYHQNVTIYCNEKLIYNFPVENNNPFSSTPGYNWNFVTLPYKYNNLNIKITSPYDSYKTYVPTFYLGNTTNILGKITSSSFGSLLICIIIFCFGICMILYWIYVRCHMAIKPDLLYLGIFGLFLSIWSANETRIITLLLQNNLVCSYLSFISLMLLPLPFALFVRSYYQDESKIWDIFCFVNIIQIIVCIILQLFKIADLCNTLWMTHVILAFLIFTIIISTMRLIKQKEKLKLVKLHILCILICIITLIMDVISYYITTEDGNTFGRIGFLLYIVILGISSVRDYAALMKLGQEAALYQKLAFTDQMTKLSNRTAFNRDFEIFSASPEEVAIVGFDLNCLKKINDTLGHSLGDDYIINSSKIISNTFGSAGKCYRVGGDEFVTIIENASDFDFNHYFNMLEHSIDSYNATQKNTYMQIAYGYAIYDSSLDKSLEDTYNRADKNMYINKQYKKRSRS